MANEQDLAVIEANPEEEPEEHPYLSVREKIAFKRYLKEGGHKLSPLFQAELYCLFLAGRPCAEIARIKGGVELGAVIYARVEYEWDKKLHEHVEGLMATAADRVRQVQLESVHFMADLLTATHKKEKEAIELYLQTGDPKDLGSLLPTSTKQYRDILEMLRTLTGQDKVAAGENGSVVIRDSNVIVQSSSPQAEEALDTLAPGSLLKMLESTQEDMVDD